MNAAASSLAAAGGEVPPLPPDAVEVGRVAGAWGVKGAIKVLPFAAAPQALFSSKRWHLLAPDLPRAPRAPAPAAKAAGPAFPMLLKVVSAKEQGDGIVATAQDLNDRDAAQALKGARIYVSRASFPTPDEGEFYWVDLIGLAVANREGQALGQVVGLVETGPHCVLRVQPADAAAAELMIPFVDAYVDQVDLPAKRLLVDWQADY